MLILWMLTRILIGDAKNGIHTDTYHTELSMARITEYRSADIMNDKEEQRISNNRYKW